MKIVLVHLNTKIPRYARNNLTRIRKSFPENEVFLISNKKQPEIRGVSLKLYEESLESKTLMENLSHPREFRDNFWHSSIARFVYLYQFQSEINEPVLHIESDVIISSDFPIHKFHNISGLAFPILSKFRGVASIFYSGNRESLSLFVKFIVKEAKENHEVTDMTALRKYYDLHPNFVEVLPAGPINAQSYESEIVEDIYPRLIAGIKYYRGVFDGSDIGMYLFGTDPRNKLGRTLLRNEIDSTYTKMSEMKFRYNNKRDFLDVESNGQWIPVFNLHMTCKDVSLFSTRQMEKAFYRYLEFSTPTEIFIPKIYIRMGFKKLVRIISALNK